MSVITVVVSGPTPVVRIVEINSPGPQGATGPTGPTGPMGTTDHLLLTNIGTNTHVQVDSHIANMANPHSVTKSQVGLGNADNTSDANKPVSSAQAIAIAVVQSDVDAHEANTSNPHSTTAAQVGADPTGTAAAAIATHVGLADPHTQYTTAAEAAAAAPVQSVNGATGIVVLVKADVGLGNVDNTSDVNKPVSTATQTALDGKVDENSAIVGATKTKITYDAKGLVTAGADATTADVNDSTNRRYITDAQLVVVGNTSGTNTGDQDLSGLVPYVGAAADIDLGNTQKITNCQEPLAAQDVATKNYVDTFTGFVPYTGATGNVDIGTNKYIGLAGQFGVLENSFGDTVFDLDLRKAQDTSNVLSFDFETRSAYRSDGVEAFNWANGLYIRLDPAMNSSVLFFEGGSTPYIEYNAISDALSFGNTTLFNVTQQYIHFNEVLDSFSFPSINPNTRWLYDAGGSYPSIDYGNYQLLNINISNTVPLLDWSLSAGGSVHIYDGYNAVVVGDFSGKYLNNSTGAATLGWNDYQLFDNYNQASLDWNYHTLNYLGTTNLNWELKSLFGQWEIDSAFLLNGTANFQTAAENSAISKRVLKQSTPAFNNSRRYNMAGTVTNLITTGFGSNASESVRVLSGNNVAGGSVTTYYGGSDVNRGRIGNNRSAETFGSTDFGSKFRVYISLSAVISRVDFATDSFAFAWGTHYASHVAAAGITQIRDTSAPGTTNYLVGFQILPGGLVSLFRKNGAGATVASATLTTLTDVRDVGNFCLEHDGTGNINLYRNDVYLGTFNNAPVLVTGSTSVGYALTTTASSLAREWVVQNLGLVWE